MDTCFPVTHSILSADALASDVLPRYGLGPIDAVRFLNPGLNDTYVVEAASGEQYILRVYRRNWRTFEDIAYEVDVLNHLSNKGASVSTPIPQQDGDFIQTVPAPEGDRHVVLFDYAKGKLAARGKSDSEALNYGKAAAIIHNAAQDFSSKYKRFTLDLTHLVDTPTEIMRPVFSRRNDDWEYLQQLIKKVRHELDELPIGDLEQGFCHGDLHGGNAHSDDDGQIKFFDFDCGGWGWRAYDIAVFQWANIISREERKKSLWDFFLRGYAEERSLSALDLRAVPLFVFLRYYWLLGLHTGNAHDWGNGHLDRMLDWAIKGFRELEKDYFSDPE